MMNILMVNGEYFTPSVNSQFNSVGYGSQLPPSLDGEKKYQNPSLGFSQTLFIVAKAENLSIFKIFSI